MHAKLIHREILTAPLHTLYSLVSDCVKSITFCHNVLHFRNIILINLKTKITPKQLLIKISIDRIKDNKLFALSS